MIFSVITRKSIHDHVLGCRDSNVGSHLGLGGPLSLTGPRLAACFAAHGRNPGAAPPDHRAPGPGWRNGPRENELPAAAVHGYGRRMGCYMVMARRARLRAVAPGMGLAPAR